MNFRKLSASAYVEMSLGVMFSSVKCGRKYARPTILNHSSADTEMWDNNEYLDNEFKKASKPHMQLYDAYLTFQAKSTRLYW